VRYQNQLKELKDKGYFMTKDGMKSTDLPQKKRNMSKKDKQKMKAAVDKAVA